MLRLVLNGLDGWSSFAGRRADTKDALSATIVSRNGPGDSQRRPSADRNSPSGGSLIQTDGLGGAVLGGEKGRVRLAPPSAKAWRPGRALVSSWAGR